MIFHRETFGASAPRGSSLYEFQMFFVPAKCAEQVFNGALRLDDVMLPAMMCDGKLVKDLATRYRELMSWSVMRAFTQMGGVSRLVDSANLPDPALRALLYDPEDIACYHRKTNDRQLGVDLALPKAAPVAAAKLCVDLNIRVPNWESLICVSQRALEIYRGDS